MPREGCGSVCGTGGGLVVVVLVAGLLLEDLARSCDVVDVVVDVSELFDDWAGPMDLISSAATTSGRAPAPDDVVVDSEIVVVVLLNDVSIRSSGERYP